ncbi:MAG: hypothetical protein EBR82_62190 [Caulobacteraceae bacterium]|nr:hypothetical protein [Caulobacteraceae bacterium]
MLAAGGSRLAAELLGVLREERRRRPTVPCTPSIDRLAALVAVGGAPPSHRTVQRALAWLQANGYVWRVYRGGRGQRSLYYLRPPRPEEVELRGRRIIGAAAAKSAPAEASAEPLAGCAEHANPVTDDGVTGARSLDLEMDHGKTKGAGAEPGAASLSETHHNAAPRPPAPSRREGERAPAVPLPTLAAVWAIWLRVWNAKQSGQRYLRRPHDGSAAIGIARRLAGAGDLERTLTWNVARYIHDAEHADEGSPLHRFAGWLRRCGTTPPDRWDARRLRLAPLAAAPPRAPFAATPSSTATPAPAAALAGVAALLKVLE